MRHRYPRTAAPVPDEFAVRERFARLPEQAPPDMVNLLVLLRFEGLDARAAPAREAMLDYARRARECGGRVVDQDADQLLVCLADMRWALQSLRNLLALARRDGFAVRAAIVQAVLARAGAAPESGGFTARTLETLLRLAGEVGRQQVGITPKLLSLIQLAAPEFADLFETADTAAHRLLGGARPQPVLVMAG
ncbi:MAG: hypothetical protein DWB43_07440 [Lautropia sp.]|nr:hypothetical protein [Lautropia sp.]RIK85879.1 MAG: hypothetical protein DCC70_14345 [Burkholderiales bacterium]